MQTVESTLTKDFKTTIPKAVREHLGLQPGDYIIWCVENGIVSIRKATELSYTEHLLANEWLSKADEESFKDL